MATGCVNQPTTTLFPPFEAIRPMVKRGVLAVNPWEEAPGLDPEAVHYYDHVDEMRQIQAERQSPPPELSVVHGPEDLDTTPQSEPDA